RGLEHVGLELEPMHTITDPRACGGDPLAGPNRRCVAHHGHEVALAAGLHLEDAEAVLVAVEGDALDRARERLDRRAALNLSRSDHPVHTPIQGTTAALALSSLRT